MPASPVFAQREQREQRQQRPVARLPVPALALAALAPALALTVAPAVATAATCTWNKATAANWDASTGNWSCGHIPTTTDDVVFSSSGTGTCSLNVAVSVISISLNSGAGTVSGSGAVNVTLSGNYTQSAGTFTATSTQTIQVDGNFNLSGGTFTSTTGRLEVGGAFNKTGGTFNANNGQLILTSTANQTFATNSATFNDVTINDGLLGYWKLDETATPSVDSSGWGRDATWSSTPAGSATVPTVKFTDSRSLSIDSSADYASFSAPAAPVITISAWVKATAAGGGTYQRILEIPGYTLFINGAGLVAPDNPMSLAFTANHATTPGEWKSPSNSLTYGAWYHVAITYDSSSLSNDPVLYINGASQTLTEKTAPTGAQTSNVGTGYIGNRAAVDRYFNGLIDELRIYDRALSATEINSLAIGRQPSTYLSTQSMTGNPIIAGDLVIASGMLSVGANDLSVGGSWWNYGGIFRASSGNNVTFNGSGSSFIRSGGHEFQDVTVNGTATWTLADDMELARAKTLFMTAGGLDLSSRTFRGGNIDKTASVSITPSTSTVVLNGTTSSTLDPGSFTNLHIEVPSETNLVGYWKFDQGEGPLATDLATTPHNGTLTNGPSWENSGLPPAIEYVNQGALTLDGSNDYVDIASAVVASNSSFSACAWVKLASLTGHQNLVTVDGTNISGFYLKKDGSTGKFVMQMLASDSSAATVYYATGSTTPTTGTWYHVCGVFDGTNENVYVNGNLEDTTPVLATWNATGHTIIGASKWMGARADFLNGTIDDVRLYNTALTAAQVAALAAGRYANTGTSITYTLGANTTVSGALAVDSGTLATGTGFTMNASAAGTVAYVNTGAYTVGNSSSTFAGGLTVRDAGTLNMATSGGSVKIGSTKTLTIDGNFNASSTGATIQTAGAGGTFYGFQVGSTSTATPTLNITGLAVKNTDTNGMYVNAVVGSITTFTRFDNIAFSSGTGTRLLQIYAPSLYLASNGCSFDGGVASGTTTYNVTLRGDGSATETRVLFGDATCATNKTPCESNDNDDDSGADGVGDTTATNAAVAQWVHGAQADTSGTIEGFPTAAFDWNTFTYYSTYVAYHDVGGATADRIYVRDTDGNPKTTSSYWDTPSGVDIVGTPRYDTLSISPFTHYVYVATSNGKVYRLIDNTTSNTLTQDNSGNWAGANNPFDCACTITTPLTVDSNNIYWGGTASGNKVWTLGKTSRTLASSSPFTVTAVISGAAPTAWTSGDTYVFMGSAAHFYKVDITTQTLTTDNSSPTGTVNGRLSLINSKLYGADNRGSLWVLNPTSFGTTLWSYHDDRVTVGHSGCLSGDPCAVTSPLYVDYLLNRVYYGDHDSHIYASYNSSGTTGAQLTGFPWRPTASTTEVYNSAPFYNAGVLVMGTTTGNVYVIDVNGGSGPVLKQTYKFGATTNISGVGYDRGSSSYMIAASDPTTKDGKLIYIDAMTDPTPGSN